MERSAPLGMCLSCETAEGAGALYCRNCVKKVD